MRSSSLIVALLLGVGCGSDQGSTTEADAGSGAGQADAGDAGIDVPGDGSGRDASEDSGEGSGNGYVFAPYAPDETPVDVTTDRLCVESADPEGAPDKTFITCRSEGSNAQPVPDTAEDVVTVMTWNLERGVHLDEMIAFWRSGVLPVPDILLASEVDRGCSRSGSRDVSRVLAEALGYNYAFGVEFVELPRPTGSGGAISETCEHGNAVFSRYRLGNVETKIHAANTSWYLPPEERASGEPRLGGRSFVQADVDLGGGRYLRVISVHFESDVRVLDIQRAQATEVAERGAESPVPSIIGGDTNNVAYLFDVSTGRDDNPDDVEDGTVRVFLDRGFVDPHRFVDPDERPTRQGLVLDLLFGSHDFWGDAFTCSPEVCTSAISDHQPVWAEVNLGTL